MSKIVGQHEAETQKEIKARQRAAFWDKVFGHVRMTFIFLVVATLAVVVFNYREQLVKFVSSKPAAEPTGQAAGILKGAQDNAAKRDAVINEISK